MSPPAVIEVESGLTDRYQTTVPEPVRRALHLSKRDRIRYRVLGDGSVNLERAGADQDHNDPIVGRFVDFLARDIEQHPERLRALTPELRNRVESLIAGVDVDLDEPLPSDDE